MYADPILLASSADEHYAPGLAVMMRSLLDHCASNRTIVLHVLETDLSDATKQCLLDSWNDPRLTVHFVRPNESAIAQLTCFKGVHRAMYLHLTLPDVLPQHARVLLLDADMLVQHDIAELWDTDIGNAPMGAVQENAAPLVSSPLALPNYDSLGLDPLTRYCNAGLLLMNLDVWRAEGIATRIIDYTVRNASIIRYWDQDGVNAVTAGRWYPLDATWNVCSEGQILNGWKPDDPERVQQLIADAKIIHFVIHKPWQPDCAHPKTALFLSYLRRTAWRDLAESLTHSQPQALAQPEPVQMNYGWFNHHVPVWSDLLSTLRGMPDVHALEIGTWTGQSTCWMLQNIITHPLSSLTCIDTFERDRAFERQAAESEMILPALPEDFSIERGFRENMRLIGAEHRVCILKGYSQEVLRTLPASHFDFIYVDGSHIVCDVLTDAVISWQLLKQNGLLIFDDYQLRMYASRLDNPAAAIDAFLALFHGRYEVMHAGWQIVVRKRDFRQHPPLLPGKLQNAVDNARPSSWEELKAQQAALLDVLSAEQDAQHSSSTHQP